VATALEAAGAWRAAAPAGWALSGREIVAPEDALDGARAEGGRPARAGHHALRGRAAEDARGEAALGAREGARDSHAPAPSSSRTTPAAASHSPQSRGQRAARGSDGTAALAPSPPSRDEAGRNRAVVGRWLALLPREPPALAPRGAPQSVLAADAARATLAHEDAGRRSHSPAAAGAAARAAAPSAAASSPAPPRAGVSGDGGSRAAADAARRRPVLPAASTLADCPAAAAVAVAGRAGDRGRPLSRLSPAGLPRAPSSGGSAGARRVGGA